MFPDEVLPIGTRRCCSLHTLLVGREGRVVLLIEVMAHQHIQVFPSAEVLSCVACFA